MTKSFIYGTIIVCSFICVGLSKEVDAAAIQNTIPFDEDWRFSLTDPQGAQANDFSDAAWEALDLPHDWSILGAYDAKNPTGEVGGRLPAGVGWYRKSFTMEPAWEGKQVLIRFDATYMDSTIYLNGVKVGGRPYGYISYIVDLTPHLKPGVNTLAVRLDNALQPSSRWYVGCGIYGHVNLLVKEPFHLVPWGIAVTTPEVSASSASVVVQTEVEQKVGNGDGVLIHRLLDVEGVVVAESKISVATQPGTVSSSKQKLTISNPQLWSPDHPVLYSLMTELKQGDRVVDKETTTVGIRSLRWDVDKGLFLNDRPLKLKGVCEHHDIVPVGAAIPKGLIERRLKQLMEMGCNAVRTSHHPRTPEFYDLCDRMGILVMNEIFDGWKKKVDYDYGARFFETWWKKDVTDWVRRDRNHPSVILWGIGNETGHSDIHGITPFIKAIDSSRAVTGGDVLDGVDVSGFNGRSVKNDQVLINFHKKNPQQSIILSEEPHTFQTRGFYQAKSEIKDPSNPIPEYGEEEVFSPGPEAYRSSYDNCGRRVVVRDCWRRTSKYPWIAGEFRWTGFDYIGEAKWAGDQMLARAFNFGVIDLAGFPKDHFYLHQSLWTTKPMVHLLPHWSWPGLEGKMIPVVAYANAEEVELFKEGKSLGKKRRSDLYDFVWQVPYQPGELKAVAYQNGREVATTIQRTAGAPVRVLLSADNTQLQARREDLSLVTMTVVDSAGVMVPDACDRIDVATIGPVQLLGYENGDPIDLTSHRVDWRRAFNGLARGFYSGKDQEDGPVEVVTLSALRDFRTATPACVSLAVSQIALRGDLPKGDFSIHFTTDGSEPTQTSPRYMSPLSLNKPTTVRACAIRDGKIVVSTIAEIKPEPKPVYTKRGPGGEQGEAEDPTQVKKRKS